MKNGLIYPRLRVLLDDGAEFEVQPLGPDQIAFEFESVKRKWPEFQRIPATWQYYLAWSRAKRDALIDPGLTWDDWRNGRCAYVAPVDLGDDDADDDPTDAPFTDPVPDTG